MKTRDFGHAGVVFFWGFSLQFIVDKFEKSVKLESN